MWDIKTLFRFAANFSVYCAVKVWWGVAFFYGPLAVIAAKRHTGEMKVSCRVATSLLFMGSRMTGGADGWWGKAELDDIITSQHAHTHTRWHATLHTSGVCAITIQHTLWTSWQPSARMTTAKQETAYSASIKSMPNTTVMPTFTSVEISTGNSNDNDVLIICYTHWTMAPFGAKSSEVKYQSSSPIAGMSVGQHDTATCLTPTWETTYAVQHPVWL